MGSWETQRHKKNKDAKGVITMGRFDGYYKGDKKKLSKKELEKKTKKLTSQTPYTFKPPEIIKKEKSGY